MYIVEWERGIQGASVSGKSSLEAIQENNQPSAPRRRPQWGTVKGCPGIVRVWTVFRFSCFVWDLCYRSLFRGALSVQTLSLLIQCGSNVRLLQVTVSRSLFASLSFLIPFLLTLPSSPSLLLPIHARTQTVKKLSGRVDTPRWPPFWKMTFEMSIQLQSLLWRFLEMKRCVICPLLFLHSLRLFRTFGWGVLGLSRIVLYFGRLWGVLDLYMT